MISLALILAALLSGGAAQRDEGKLLPRETVNADFFTTCWRTPKSAYDGVYGVTLTKGESASSVEITLSADGGSKPSFLTRGSIDEVRGVADEQGNWFLVSISGNGQRGAEKALLMLPAGTFNGRQPKLGIPSQGLSFTDFACLTPPQLPKADQ